MSSYSEVQCLTEVPSIAYLCSLFHNTLGTPDFEINELEDALVFDVNHEDDMFGGTFLDNINISLLKGCIPSYKNQLTCRNYSLYLIQFLNSKIEDFEEEENLTVKPNIFNPFNDEKQEFNQLDIQEKVKVILQLIELRLEADDVPDKIKNIPVESLRLDPIGEDSNGHLYWYFYGTRLYKEVKQKRKQNKPKTDKKSEEKAKKSTKDTSKKKKDKVDNEHDKSSDVSLVETEDVAAGWYLICQTESDWNKLAETLKKSKKKADKEMYQTLEENYIEQISKMFQDQEREERLKIMLMNKRSSSRIVRKEQERKIEEEKRKIEEERLRLAQEKEDKKRRDAEDLKRLKENHLSSTRETRGREKIEKLIIEQESKGTREQRLKEREIKRASVESDERAVREKKTRLDVERLRREAVERDHDYFGLHNYKGKSSRRGSERAAATKEWHRLMDIDDANTVRSIRV